MSKRSIRVWSVLMVIIMIFNMLPVHALAAETTESVLDEQTEQEYVSTEDVHVVEEMVDRRTEYTKVFQLSNGLYLASVYDIPVHYEVNGQWAEIDNTLQLASTRSGNTYTNTAGIWQVSFPQSMTENNGVTITKDGYVFNFQMAGELLDPELQDVLEESEIIVIPAATEDGSDADEDTTPAEEEVAAVSETDKMEGGTEVEQETTIDVSAGSSEEKSTETADENLAVVSTPDESVVAEIENIDMEAVKEDTEYPETVVEKINSRLSYEEIYEDTDIVFDLQSNRMKESIVLKAYRDDLKGYIYTLEVGDLIPVLLETGEIELRDAYGEEVIMYMPAPYLIDNAGTTCFDIEVSLEGENGKYFLAYELPRAWLANEDRQWPIILDPAVQPVMNTSNIRDITVCANGGYSHNNGSLLCGYYKTNHTCRIYVKYRDLPQLTAADVIVYADMRMCMMAGNYDSNTSVPVMEVHKVKDVWESETITWANKPDFDSIVEDFAVTSEVNSYYNWDVTDLVREWYEGENTGMMFKMSNSAETAADVYSQFYSADYSKYQLNEKPMLTIIFRNNNGLESYWDYTTSSAGRAGTGYVNQYTGNLVWIRDDIGFGGNRMPVTISHVYNANDSTENLFGMGNGWRTNFNQQVYRWQGDNAYGDYYVWEDSDGTDHYFQYESSNTYKDEDGLELTLTIHGSGTSRYYLITDKYGNTSRFDNNGRLVKQENNQATKSSITITYTTSDGLLISSITDGAGRVYSFTYTNNLLSKISYKGKGTSEITNVNFGYTNSNLITVTDKDSKVSRYTYTTNNLMSSAQDIDGYKINYAYTTTTAGKPNRINTITEYSGSTAGGVLNIEYAHNQTKFTDYNGNVQIIQFNNMGNTISVQDDQGRAQYAQYAINDPTSTENASTTTTRATGTAKGNQLLLASKLQNTVGNVLSDSSFENGTNWTALSSLVTGTVTSETAYMGSKSLKMTRATDGAFTGLRSATISIPAGETYTFSGYVKTDGGSSCLVLTNGSNFQYSEYLPADTDWTRLEVSYTNTTSAAVNVSARVETYDAGTTYLDCVQVEKAPTASRYNLIQNGDFRTTASWSSTGGRTTVTAANKTPAPQLDVNVYKMTGNPQAKSRLSQTIKVSGASGDTFVLAGWAKADSVPIRDTREFALIATFKKGSTTVNTSIVRFNYCADSTINWQYAASPIVANGAYDSIVVELAYDYNANTVYFDGIQLFKEEFGNSYTYDDNGNIISVKDVQSQNTSYQYTNNNLTKQVLPSSAVLTYTYDNYHNVKTAKSSTGVTYNFEYDTYGNNTSVSIVSGSVKLTSTAKYTEDDYNRLASTTDAAGNVTTYSYDENTNVLKSVQYPNSSLTTYSYDNMYRLDAAASNVTVGTTSMGTLTADYVYENDLLKSITTGSTQYSFNYEDFTLRSNIQIGTRVLASYIYKDINDTEARFADEKFEDAPKHSLVGLDYGNGDKVQYTYDKLGRVTTQEYLNDNVITSTVSYAYDNNGNLAKTTNSATSGWDVYYYDFTDRLVKTSSKHNGSSYSVEYGYDSNNNLATLREGFPGYTRETGYTYDKDNRITKMDVDDDSTFYAYDSYGRLSTRTTTGHSPTLKETYTYRTVNSNQTGQVEKLNITATNYSNGFEYTYDSNGNILTVKNGGKTTKYTYDSANQLVREDNQRANKTWYWTYDNAGNITSRKEYAYTTGTLGAVQSTVNYTYDGTWGDLLTGYNGKTITSDTIGNMLSDGTWTYTWENGRQLASMTSGSTTWSYKYNTDGMRIERKSGSTTYKYFYTGDKLVQMSTPTSILRFTYDSSGKPLTVVVDGTPYYYVTNLQGDVIAILNTSGTSVVQYTYDAWGKILTTTGSMASTLGTDNPLHYRGYVYDTETGLYYLQSRYYDPEIGRFINGDVFVSTGQGLLGNNMFVYCLNNPVNHLDSYGLIATGIGGIEATYWGKTEIQSSKSDNPKNNPPDHPDFHSPKKGNRKKKNPNGNGWGWEDKQGNVWVWNPGMHGGEGWIIQQPDGGHSHAYPGGGIRTHFLGTTEYPLVTSFPAIQTIPNMVVHAPLIAGGAVAITVIAISTYSRLGGVK